MVPPFLIECGTTLFFTNMTKLIALRPLTGDYGFVEEGKLFQVEEEDAIQLEARGLAKRPYVGTPTVDSFKLKFPIENKALLNNPGVMTRRR